MTLSHWRDEGFAVTCIPYDGNVKVLETQLMHIANSLEASQKYGLIGKFMRIKSRVWSIS